MGSYKAVSFAACMSHAGTTPEEDATACASTTGIDGAKLLECFHGDKVRHDLIFMMILEQGILPFYFLKSICNIF